MAYICGFCKSLVADIPANNCSHLCPMESCTSVANNLKKLAHIDSEIAPYIQKFWKNGLFTLLSCAGHMNKYGNLLKAISAPYVQFVSHDKDQMIALLEQIRLITHFEDVLDEFCSGYDNPEVISISDNFGVRILTQAYTLDVENIPVRIVEGEPFDPYIGYLQYSDPILSALPHNSHCRPKPKHNIRGYYHLTIRPQYLEIPTTEEFYRYQGKFYSVLEKLSELNWRK